MMQPDAYEIDVLSDTTRKEPAMRSLPGYAACVAVAVCACACAAFAEDEAEAPRLSFSVDAAYNSKYVWRGILLTDDPVFQPSVTAGYGGLSLNVWGNMDLSDINDQENKFSEVDCTLGYARAIDRLVLEAGAIYYAFPNTKFDSTSEVYVGAGLDVLLQPGIRAYFDTDESEGAYFSAAIGHTFALDERLELGLSAAIGYGNEKNNSFYHGVDEAAFTDASCSVSLPISFSESFSVTPSITLTTLLDDKIRDELEDDVNAVFGFTFSYGF